MHDCELLLDLSCVYLSLCVRWILNMRAAEFVGQDEKWNMDIAHLDICPVFWSLCLCKCESCWAMLPTTNCRSAIVICVVGVANCVVFVTKWIKCRERINGTELLTFHSIPAISSLLKWSVKGLLRHYIIWLKVNLMIAMQKFLMIWINSVPMCQGNKSLSFNICGWLHANPSTGLPRPRGKTCLRQKRVPWENYRKGDLR